MTMELAFKPLKARFRASFAAAATNEPRMGKVDREALTLHDVQITLEGEAKGHNVWLDRAFCEDVAKAGNGAGDAGVKVRFGHPAMCSDAIGTYLGRAKNFRVVDVTRKESGEQAAGVIADIELYKNADRTEWILNMAESAPDMFGQSIVFTYGDYKVKDEKGVEHSYVAECVEGVEDSDSKSGKRICKTPKSWREQSADGKVYVVLGKLHGTDFTDTPAATDGVFSDTSLAAEAERMLDEHPQIVDVLEKNPDSVYQFLSRIGILDRIESTRVAGIQAAKDKELAELRETLKLAQSVADKKVVELGEQMAEMKKQFESELKSKTEELATANAEVERLGAELEKSLADLAETGKQLSKASSTIAMLGHNVNRAPAESCQTGSVETLKSLPMKDREAYYRSHFKGGKSK